MGDHVATSWLSQPGKRPPEATASARGRGRLPDATRFIVILLILYAAKQIFAVAAFYPFSGHDELAHYSYIRTLVTERRLPVLPDLETWRDDFSSGGEPPPTDQIPAELYDYCRYTLDWYCEPNSPQWGDDPPRVVFVPGLGNFPSGYQYVANHPPLYYAVMAPVFRAASSLAPLDQHYLLRLAAIPFGLLTVYAAYRATRALFPGDAFLTVTVPALIAFQPQISYEAAMINNDIVAIAVTSLLLWGLVVGIRDRFPLRLCAALGGLIGIGLLAKSTTLAVIPVVAVAVVLALGWRDAPFGSKGARGGDSPLRWRGARGGAWRDILLRGAIISVPAALLAAPWYLFLYRTYGDFSGLARVEALQYWSSPMGSFFELLFNPGFVVARFRETWGEFGWRLIHLSPVLLWAIALPTIAGIIGLIVFIVAARRDWPIARGDAVARPATWQWQALAVLALACVAAYLAVVQFGTQFALSQARYYFPVVNAAAILVMLGLRTLIPLKLRPAAQGIVVGALVLLNVVIVAAYVLPFTSTVDEPFVTWTWGG